MALSLKDFYHRIIKNKIPYCMVCLRTEKERFLTDVKRYNTFARNCIPLKAQGSLYNRDNGGQVCKTCDGWLRRGLQVMNAVLESKNANCYFSHLSDGWEANPPVLRHLESTRRNWSLTATETLVISTDLDPPSEPSEPQSTVTVTHEKDCVVIIEHDITDVPPLEQRNDIHSVVTLEDSDDETKKPAKRLAPKELPSTELDSGLSITPVPPTAGVDPNVIGPQSLLIPVMNLLIPTNPAAADAPIVTSYPQQPFMLTSFPAVVTVNNCDTNTITGDLAYNSNVLEVSEVDCDEANGCVRENCSKADTAEGDVVIDADVKKEKNGLNISTRKRGKHKTYPCAVRAGEMTPGDSQAEVDDVAPSPEESETLTNAIAACSNRKVEEEVEEELPEKRYRFNRKTRVIEVSASANGRSFVQVPKEIPAVSLKQNVDWEDEIPMDVIVYHGHSVQFPSS